MVVRGRPSPPPSARFTRPSELELSVPGRPPPPSTFTSGGMAMPEKVGSRVRRHSRVAVKWRPRCVRVSNVMLKCSLTACGSCVTLRNSVELKLLGAGLWRVVGRVCVLALVCVVWWWWSWCVCVCLCLCECVHVHLRVCVVPALPATTRAVLGAWLPHSSRHCPLSVASFPRPQTRTRPVPSFRLGRVAWLTSTSTSFRE